MPVVIHLPAAAPGWWFVVSLYERTYNAGVAQRPNGFTTVASFVDTVVVPAAKEKSQRMANNIAEYSCTNQARIGGR